MADVTEGPVFQARGVSKFFPGVKALEGVSISLARGSIHALLGENGAGKSTLIKLITGVLRPDQGELFVDGKPVQFSTTREAIAAGIGVVHQERNLIPRFSVGENIMLERLSGRPSLRARSSRRRRGGGTAALAIARRARPPPSGPGSMRTACRSSASSPVSTPRAWQAARCWARTWLSAPIA